MLSAAPKESDLSDATVAFYSGLFGSLGLCIAIHLLAPGLTADRSLMRMGLIVVFFGCLASATWRLTSPYARFISLRLRWEYADASPAVRRNIERVASRKARYFATLGHIGTVASGLWGLAMLAEWPLFAPIAPMQSLLGWLAVLAWIAFPLAAVLYLRPLREALELRRQVDEDLRASGGTRRSAESRARQRSQDTEPPVQVTAPLRFRSAGQDWLWSDFYKNAAIFGMSGSGKTLCVLNSVLDGLIASSSLPGQACAGLILDPKGDYRDKIEVLCRENGRERDLVILDPANMAQSIRWNPLDSSDDALEVAGRFGAVMQILSETSGDDTFWIESAMRLVQNILALHRIADPDNPPSLVDIYEGAMSDDVLQAVQQRIPDAYFEQNRSAMRVAEYFINVWSPMPSDPRGSARAFVANMLGSFLIEPYDTLFSGKSDVTLSDVVEKGLILYVHMPIADRETMARVVSTFIKLEYYREVLKRPNKARPSFFLCDEFQSFFTVGQGRGDPDAFERTRQSNHANIVAFQNINALYKQTDKREQVANLLGNCATKIFLRNTDEETNKDASALFGKQMENLGSSSVNIGGSARGRGETASISGSDQYQDRIKPDEFLTLAVPSVEDGIHHAEAISHLAARSEVRMERQRWKVHPIRKRLK